MVRVLIVAGFALLAFNAHARAQSWVTGSQLAHACAGHTPKDMSDCDGYVAGVLDTVGTTPALKGTVCPPANTKLGALREALGKFGQQRPAETKGSGVELVESMMKTNYPCPAH